MRIYNEQDVRCLEELYLRMRPWILNHPNVNVFKEDIRPRCGKCGSAAVHYRGYYHSNVAKYHRVHCEKCGAWSRERFTQYDKEAGHKLLTGAL